MTIEWERMDTGSWIADIKGFQLVIFALVHGTKWMPAVLAGPNRQEHRGEPVASDGAAKRFAAAIAMRLIDERLIELCLLRAALVDEARDVDLHVEAPTLPSAVEHAQQHGFGELSTVANLTRDRDHQIVAVCLAMSDTNEAAVVTEMFHDEITRAAFHAGLALGARQIAEKIGGSK